VWVTGLTYLNEEGALAWAVQTMLA